MRQGGCKSFCSVRMDHFNGSISLDSVYLSSFVLIGDPKDRMIKQLRLQRFLAMIYIGVAVGIAHFWWQVFNSSLFIIDELVPNVQAYYLWVNSLVIPDLVLAVSMLASALPLWTNRSMARGRTAAAGCAGAALCLGILDLGYGFSCGFYALEHAFSEAALEVALSRTVAGFVGLVILLLGEPKPN